jgi:uncharacterized OB-fold protein
MIATPSRPVPSPNGFVHTEPFWNAARNRKLFLQFCLDTNQFQHQPRPVSMYTGSRNLAWRQVSGNGVIYAFSTLRVGRPDIGARLPLPVAIIELDEHVRIVGNVFASDPENIRIGQRVTLYWDLLDNEMPYPAFQIASDAVSVVDQAVGAQS